MCWLFVNMLGSTTFQIQDAHMPKEAWDTLVKSYGASEIFLRKDHFPNDAAKVGVA